MTFSAAFSAWLQKPARRCLLAHVVVKSGGSEITRYLSTAGYTTGPAETPADTVYSGRIVGGLQFTRRLDLSGSGGSAAWGDLELDNTDHALDSWLSDIWARRAITLYLGDPSWARADFVQIWTGTLEGIEAKARDRLTLHLSDILAPLNDTFSTATVGGSGDNANALLPYALGECFNVTPILIDAATQKYSAHNGVMEDFIEVRDNGVAVAVTETVASGYFTLTNARWGDITTDVQGAKVSGAYRNDAGGLAEWVATSLGNGQQLAAGDFDSTLLTAFRAACAQPVGLYLPQTANRLAVMQQLVASVGASVTTTGAGKVQFVRLAFGTPGRAIGPWNMKPESFQPVQTCAPRGAWRLAYGRNWTPNGNAIAGSVVAASLPILRDEYNYVDSTDATVLSDYKQNSKPEAVETLLVVQSDAQTECDRRKTLWATQRQVYSFAGYGELLDVEIGDTITLTYPHFGLSGGATALVVGVEQEWVNTGVRLEVLV